MRAEFPHMRTQDLADAMGRTLNSVRTRGVLLGLQKTPEALSKIQSESFNYENNGGSFRKGIKPWNAGKVGEYRLAHGAPLGTQRVSDGYQQIKVRMDGPFHLRWRGLHLLTWEEHHGPAPKGFVVSFRDGDKSNVDIGNLHLLTLRQHLDRQSSHIHGPEIFRLHQLRGQITRQLNKRKRKEAHG